MVVVSCSTDPISNNRLTVFVVNWTLYTQLVQASIVLLNVVSNSVQSLLELSGPRDPLPGFDYDNISDSECVHVLSMSSMLLTKAILDRVMILPTSGYRSLLRGMNLK